VSKPVKVLLVEDSEDDAKLALRALRLGGFEATYRRIQTPAILEAMLAQEPWDAVISDFNMPDFNGMDALRIFRRADLDIPFILLSGAIGEETAVEAMKAGANDYIMKSSVARLAPALERELREAQMRADHRRGQRELIASEERFRSLTALSSDWYWEQDENFRFTRLSPGLKDKFSDVDAWIGKARWELPYRNADWTEHRATLEARKPFRDVELQPMKPDGTFVSESISGEPWFDGDGRFLGYRGVGKDITERVRRSDELRRLNRVYAVLSGINTLIVRTNDRDELLREACRIAVDAGQLRIAWIGLVDRVAGRIVPLAVAGTKLELFEDSPNRFTLDASSPLGNTLSARAVRSKSVAVSNDLEHDPGIAYRTQLIEGGSRSKAALPLLIAGEAAGVLVLTAAEPGFFDAKEMKLLAELAGDIAFGLDHIAKRERLDYIAYYDVLTGLPNRALFHDRLAHSLQADGGEKGLVAVALLDIERFRRVNETLGRPAGDELLRIVASRLHRAIDTLARIGADLFAVSLRGVSAEEVSHALAAIVSQAFGDPIPLHGETLRISCRIGVALFPDDGGDADALLHNAEAALRSGKLGGERCMFYAAEMNARVAEALAIETRLRRAVERQEFVLHYQPKVDMKNGRVVGVEALIRWMDPERGLVPPGAFIPILEETGLIAEVGGWAITRALMDLRTWTARGLAVPRVAVNVSAIQLQRKDFVDSVIEAVHRAGDAPECLDLEITESLIMRDVESSIRKLQELRGLGIRIDMDDFGTGYSSLSYIARLPLDKIKIDRSFIVGMGVDAEDDSIVSGIIALVHSLGLRVVAEGIETRVQADRLAALGGDEAQGFYYCRPVPWEQLQPSYPVAPEGR
jgi:diguanylate cyclase (GGDEF)-like protein/PAS domain S-box-containing protein